MQVERRKNQKFSKVLHPFRAQNHSAPSCNTGIWQNFSSFSQLKLQPIEIRVIFVALIM